MAFDSTEFVLLADGNNKKLFYYDAGSDTLATVLASGYINNLDDAQNVAVGDQIIAKCTNGTAMLAVTAVAAGGDVTTAISGVGGIMGVETASTAAALAAVGIANLTATTAKTYTLSAPFAGAVKHIIKTGASTTILTVNAGAGVTFDGTNDDLTFNAANEAVTLVGLSATRWGVVSNTNGVGIS